MFHRTGKAAVICLALLAAGAATARAQSRPQVGPELSFGSSDIGVGLGVTASLPVTSLIPGARDVTFNPAFDYFFPNTGLGGTSPTYWELSANAAYHFTIQGAKLGPYAGGGLVVAHLGWSGFSNTEIGLNLLGGTTFPAGKVTPFAQLRLELRSGSAFFLTGGVLF